MRVIVVRHHAEDSPGFIADAFRAKGAEVSAHRYPEEGSLPPVGEADHVVLLGLAHSIYDPAQASLVNPYLNWLRGADEAGVPMLGICFGAQALCTAFGGQVVAAVRKEIGWTMVESAREDLIPAGPWLEFHGDRCEPPAHATILARNEIGVQAFSIGRHLAVQFHPEVDGAQLAGWLQAGGSEQALAAGLDPEALLAATIAEEPASRARADRLVETALRLAKVTESALAG